MTKVMEKITLHRNDNTKSNLFGTLNIYLENGNSASFTTVENPNKKLKEGTYPMYYGYSPRFDTNLWSLHTIDRTGIRIHSANTGNELSGCIAIGLFKTKEQIYQSKKAISILKTILDPHKTYQIEIL